MSKKSIQIEFIQAVKDVIPSNLSLVDELSDLLELSNDSVYRRIRGETALTIDEVSVICTKYNLSFDGFNNTHTNTVTFSHMLSDGNAKSITDNLKVLLSDLTYLKDEENTRFIFAAEDIPVFHYFNFRLLTCFKFFYWMKSILNHPDFVATKFNPSLIDEELLSITGKMHEEYSKISSTEIWTDETIMSTIKQIEYYWESGLFVDKQQALDVIEQLRQMLLDISTMADRGHKQSSIDIDFNMYKSDVLVGNNTILTEVNNIRATYLNYNTFNYINTTGIKFCEETDKWLANLIKKSTLISSVAEKQRYQFFKAAHDKVTHLVSLIQ